MTTSMNERTHFFIKIYLSHFIRKGWCWLCVRGELETGTDCHILTQSSSRDYSSTSSSSWLGCSTVGRWRPKSSGAGSHSAGILSPTAPGTELTSNWLLKSSWRPPASGGRTHPYRIQPRPQVKVIFRHPQLGAPASPFFCLFTQVHLLIDGSVEGQYVTQYLQKNGIPKTTITDTAPELCDESLVSWLRKIGCMLYKAPPYHTQSNNIAERIVQTVKMSLKAFSPFTQNIEAYIPNLLLSYRTLPQADRKQSPSALMSR